MRDSLGNPLRKEKPFTKTDLEGVTEQSPELGAAMATVLGEGAKQLPQGEDWSHNTPEELEMTPNEKIEKEFDDAIDEALTLVPAVDNDDVNNPANRGLGLSAIANVLSEAGRFDEVKNILKENKFDLHVASNIYSYLSSALAKRGDIKGAQSYFRHLTESSDGFFVQLEIAKFQLSAGLDHTEALMAIIANALYQRSTSIRILELNEVAVFEQSTGLNGAKRFDQALTIALSMDAGARLLSLVEIAEAQARAGIDNTSTLQLVDETVEKNPKLSSDFISLALAKALKGDFQGAIKYLRDETDYLYIDTCKRIGEIQLRNKLEPTAFDLADAYADTYIGETYFASVISLAKKKLEFGLDIDKNINFLLKKAEGMKSDDVEKSSILAEIAGLKRQAALAALEKSK